MIDDKVQKVERPGPWPAPPSAEPIVKCPKCGADVPLTAALAAPMVEAVRAEMQDQVTEARAAKEEAFQAIERRNRDLDAEVAAKAADARRAAREEARAEAAGTLKQADERNADLTARLAAAQAAQAEALRKERDVADRERELTLTVERGITEGVERARIQARGEAEEAARLRLMERDQTIAGLQVKIEELAHKAEVTSQQLAGEVQELDLEQQLRAKFPFDTIVEVGKGVNGADVTQTVMALSGAACGVILWESKRTKTFSAGWLPKLREDGRAAHADVLVLATQAMPKEVDGFDSQDNVWVVQPRLAVPLAVALRDGLLRAHAVKQAQEGMATKAEEVYSYVTGPQFKRRVEAIVESYTTMQEDLTAEQKAVQRQWAKRAAQIERVLTSTSGMFGDLQGIAGRALPAPVGLDLPQ